MPNKADGHDTAMDLAALAQLIDRDVHELRVPLLIAAANGESHVRPSMTCFSSVS